LASVDKSLFDVSFTKAIISLSAKDAGCPMLSARSGNKLKYAVSTSNAPEN
jgi:hypothetical protein